MIPKEECPSCDQLVPRIDIIQCRQCGLPICPECASPYDLCDGCYEEQEMDSDTSREA